MTNGQQYLASSIGISAGMLSHIKNGSRHASYPLAKIIADKTKTEAELWLRGGTGTPEARRAAIVDWAIRHLQAEVNQ